MLQMWDNRVNYRLQVLTFTRFLVFRYIKIAIAAISQNLRPFIVPAKIGSLDSDFSGDIFT